MKATVAAAALALAAALGYVAGIATMTPRCGGCPTCARADQP